MALGFGFRFPDLALLIEMRLVAEAHADNRHRHADDQRGRMPCRVIRFRPGDRAQEEDADDRNEIAEALPVNPEAAKRNDRFGKHRARGTFKWRSWFPRG